MMIHRYFEHFKAVADASSILKASENIHISQPSVSRSIKLLEEIIGVPLFVRKNKGVEITEYGEVLYRQVCSMENEFDFAIEEIEYIKNQKLKKLRIGSGLVWQYGVFPEIIKQYNKEFPEVQIQVATGFSENLYEEFLHSRFDIIFCDIGALEPMSGVVYEKFMDVCFSFFASCNHPLFAKSNITEADLLQYDIAVFSHSNLVTNQDIRDDHQLSVSYRRNVKYVSGSMINLLEVVSTNSYITSLPQYLHRIADKFGLKEIHPDMRRAAFPSGMVFRESALKKPHIRAYIQAIRRSVAGS